MKTRRILLTVFLILTSLILISCSGEKSESTQDAGVTDVVPENDGKYTIEEMDGLYKTQGRTIMYEQGLALLSSADVFEFNADCGGEVSVSFLTEVTEDSGDVDVFFTGYVDGKRCETRFHMEEEGEHSILLAEGLEKGVHSFKLVRQTEWNFGNIYLTGITLDGNLTAPPENSDIFIEFIGDSLTTGFGNLEHSVPGDVWGGEPIYHDATQAYPYMTADALGADLSVVAIQGIGSRCSRHSFTMNEIYNSYPRVNEKDYTYDEERSADIVVINMLANDGELRSEEKVPPKEIVAAAKELCEIVREQHPDALIVFAPAFFYKQVSEMIETELGGAANGYYVTEIPLDAAGLAGHPSVEGHEKGAEALIEYLEQLITDNGLR
ncbi:MAG: hypothetical protein IJC50_00340 [Clostridia bacterium]|nr:hypothetical protein [Clostridia bacterium]